MLKIIIIIFFLGFTPRVVMELNQITLRLEQYTLKKKLIQKEK